MNGYIAFYSGKTTEIYAESIYQAKLKAIEHFKPRKSQQHMVSVILAEKNGEVVTHSTSEF